MMDKRPILLTGGTGFIGHHLARGLRADGYPLRYLVRPESDLSYLPLHTANDLAEGDLEDEASLRCALTGCRAVVHAAAVVSFRSADTEKMESINVNGTANLVNAALDLGLSRLVYLSSVAALAREPGKMTTLQDRWQEIPAPTAYGRSKFAAEREVWRGQAEGLPVAVLYPSTVIGPGDWSRPGSPALFAKAANRRLSSSGRAGFVAVEDVVEAVRFALASETDGLRLLLNAENMTWREALEQIGRSVGVERPLREIGALASSSWWPFAQLSAWLTGKEASITRDLHRTAQADYRYDGSSYEEITGKKYRPVAEAIKRTGAVYLKSS